MEIQGTECSTIKSLCHRNSFTNHQKIIEEDFSRNFPHARKTSYYWALIDTGSVCSNHSNDDGHFDECKWNHGDTITMILDTENNTLSFQTNDNNFEVVFDDLLLCTETYMAMTIGKEGLSMQLISFLSKNTNT